MILIHKNQIKIWNKFFFCNYSGKKKSQKKIVVSEHEDKDLKKTGKIKKKKHSPFKSPK